MADWNDSGHQEWIHVVDMPAHVAYLSLSSLLGKKSGRQRVPADRAESWRGRYHDFISSKSGHDTCCYEQPGSGLVWERMGQMKMVVTSTQLRLRRRGPVCIACSNSSQFWIAEEDGERLVAVRELPDGECRVVACGRCRSRNSVVIAHVD